jgi:hypothetical protein
MFNIKMQILNKKGLFINKKINEMPVYYSSGRGI